MHYLKQLVSVFSLGVLFTIETAFYATPPANAQPIRDADCALYAVGYAAGGLNIDLVAELTGVMQGPAHGPDTIVNMLQATGFGRPDYRTFFSREALAEYLRANGNAAYIVGWQRNEDPQGHVINARTIGGRTIFIDSQCGRFTEPPTGPGYVYYAWFVEFIRFDTIVKRDPNAGSGNFTSSCQNIALFTNIDRNNSVSLSATCSNSVGNLTQTAVDLNDYISNSSGGLVWQDNGGFGGSVRNCQLRLENVTVLECEAGDGNGSWKKAAITLDKTIVNDNGKLTVRL